VSVSTDYLVVGAGASGLAFADALVAEANVDVVVVDKRHAPGGHWLDAYPFVRLHTPSAYYGVNSLALGEDRIDESDENAGYYERATGAEVRKYFADAAALLTQKGRGRVLTSHEHLGGGRDGELVRDLRTGQVHDVEVRRKVVDARYLEASIPATHAAPFDVAPGARVVPVNDLPAAAQSASSYVVLGSGKTAADACVWLLTNGVEPDRIRWIRPRDAWFYDRAHFQPLEQVGAIMEGNSLDAEAAAQAGDVDEIFKRLEASGRLVRIDPSWPATMFRGTMLSASELETLRQIADVVRLGRVRRIEPGRILLERGESQTATDTLHVDCTALGLTAAPPSRSFSPAGSCCSRCGTSRPPSTQRSSASSRPTATTTRTRTGFAHPTRTPAALKTGRAWSVAPGGQRADGYASPTSQDGWPKAGSTSCVRFPISSPSRPCRPPSSGSSSTLVRRSSDSHSWADRAHRPSQLDNVDISRRGPRSPRRKRKSQSHLSARVTLSRGTSGMVVRSRGRRWTAADRRRRRPRPPNPRPRFRRSPAPPARRRP
jgi:hypothetical protein